MNIGVIGTGNIGRALAAGFGEVGHDVVLGSREPGTVRGVNGPVETQGSAAEHGDVHSKITVFHRN